MPKKTQEFIQTATGERLLPRGLYVQTKMQEHPEAKRAIAEYIAIHYVKDFDAVLLDTGTTSEMIAEEMFARRKFLSVLTNNMGAYAAYTRVRQVNLEESTLIDAPSTQGNRGNELLTAEKHYRNDSTNPPNQRSQGNELLITGGRYTDIYESLLGEGTITSIQAFTPNVIIIEPTGLRCEEGMFCHGSEEAAVKELLWQKPTDIRLVAAHWTTIGNRDVRYSPLSRQKTTTFKVVS